MRDRHFKLFIEIETKRIESNRIPLSIFLRDTVDRPFLFSFSRCFTNVSNKHIILIFHSNHNQIGLHQVKRYFRGGNISSRIIDTEIEYDLI